MKYQLKDEPNFTYSAIEQVLANRHIPQEEWVHYMNTTDDDINSPLAFGEAKLKAAAACLMLTIAADGNALIIVDSDCDGFTSAALLINYLHDLFPVWVESRLSFTLHDGKQHGLTDKMDEIRKAPLSLVIVPDAGTNDIEEHKELLNNQIYLIVLDHHEAEHEIKHQPTSVIINNQTCDYPNKQLSGVGVTWQFCRYLDIVFNKENAEQYIDLVALGNCGDVMSMASIETKHLITKGFREDNLSNPFIVYMADKNRYSLGDEITPMGAAFYIVPFVNAMVRSGTMEEKELLFKSMLKHYAFKKVPSTKRGHKAGEMEELVVQAIRTAVNVKNRQTKAQDAGMDLLEKMIQEENLLAHKVILFKLNPNMIDANIAGLTANKIMGKYQRPVCVLMGTPTSTTVPSTPDGCPFDYEEEIMVYRGSARGCDSVGLNNFKEVCEKSGLTEWQIGHQSAFGLCIREDKIEKFLEYTDKAFEQYSSETVYYVDYCYDGTNVSAQDILDISDMKHLWGKDMDEPYVVVEHLKVTKDMIQLMGQNKNTIKISLPNDISLIKFNSSEEEYESLLSTGYTEMNIVGRCAANVWNGVHPQIKIEDYEITDKAKFYF